jgi:glycosyltransferase involved in cell wall biosynthesis
LRQESRPIRVSFVIGSLNLGGAETQLVRLVNGLDRTRYIPSIVCLIDGGELENVLAPDVPIYRANLKRTAHRRASRWSRHTWILVVLIAALRKQRPEIVHAYLPGAYVPSSIAAWLIRVPVIIAGRRGLTSFEVYNSNAWRWLAQLANRLIDAQICNSRAVRDWAIAKEGLGLERTRVIHNGIDLPTLAEVPHVPPEWKSSTASAAMVANFIHYKGHREVLQAVARVAQRHPDFRLTLIGDGPERVALMDLASELGITDNIIFGERRRDAATLIRAFDFTILGSSQEGFPNALMESMASAVPVVSTSVGGVGELVQDGVHGRLVPFGDIEALAAAIAWMIEHPQERRLMGESGRQRIADEFSTGRMIDATQTVYEEMLPWPVTIATAK